ncbi:hypothetical protein G4B88_028733 [Cannabis sativa]|uniref:Uncharacterized protein n=1 Tax=Cannabis sativa TaxID=3483 RepID=A0A7J6EYE9_CANSA|nr:hypothetical protein G4B88_028733 [Cannabis sativa]
MRMNLYDGFVAKFSERPPVLGVKRCILLVSSIHGVAPKGKKGMTKKMEEEVVSDVASDVVADMIGVGSLGSPVGMNNDVGVISIDLAVPTIRTVAQMELLRIHLGFASKLVVEKGWRSCVFCLFWLDNVDVTLLSFSRGHIDVLVSILSFTPWRFTGVYGQLDSSLRHVFWNLLRRIAYNNSDPWIYGGD